MKNESFSSDFINFTYLRIKLTLNNEICTKNL